jgi:hypothetical protein
MSKRLLVSILMVAFLSSAMAQFKIKDSQETTVMIVTNDGDVGIGVGDAQPAATLDVQGDMRLATITTKTGTSEEAVVIWDATSNKLMKRSLGTDIWDGDAVNDADYVVGNEYPTAGTAISITNNRRVNVKVDNSTIKVNGTGQLYADVSMTESDPVWISEKNNYYTKTNLNSGGTINATSNPVIWSRLKGVPSGFADGTDDVNDADANANNERQRLSFNSSTGQLTINNGGSSSGNSVTLALSDDDWVTTSGVVYNNSHNIAIGSTSNNARKLYVDGSTQITGNLYSGDLHVMGSSIKFNGNAAYDPQVGLMELNTEFSGGSYGSQKLVFTASSAQYPPDNYKITVDVDGTSRNQQTGFLCRAGGQNLGQYIAGEDGKMLISNLVPTSLASGEIKMVFHDGTYYPDQFIFRGSGVAEKASGPGDWAGLSDARVKDHISDFSDGLDILTALTPKRFVYNGKGNTVAGQNAIGLIAQDVQQVAPYAVGSITTPLNPGDVQDTELLTLDTTPFLYVTINAIKQLNARIAELERQLDELQ